MSADISRSLRHNIESLILGRDNGSDPQLYVGDTTEAVQVKGIYLSSTVAVTVPAISGTAVLPADSVSVDVGTGFGTYAPAVGDVVIALPQEALEADCLLGSAIVTAANTVEVTFHAKEGGDGVTSAAKNFKFLAIDLT